MTGRDTLLSHDVGRTSQSPKPGAGHQRLNVFVGTWHTEGQQCEGPIGPAANDAQNQSYTTHTFYNNGLANEWQSHERDGTWTLAGDWQMQGKSVKVRSTTAFSDAGHTMTSKWEQSSDGSSWETFWDVKASKAK